MKKQGHFFIVDLPTFDAVCKMEDPDATAAYLVLAAGTQGAGKVTSWSREAIATRLGFNWRKADECVARLVDRGFVRWITKSSRRARLELPIYETRQKPSVAEGRVLNLVQEGMHPKSDTEIRAASRLCGMGWLASIEDGWCAIDERQIVAAFLPLSLLGDGKGIATETPCIIERIRKGRDAMAFHLLAHLYAAQDLAHLGGVDSRLLRKTFDKEQVFATADKIVWKFEGGRDWVNWTTETIPHRGKGEGRGEKYFERVQLLEDAGAIEWLIALAEDQAHNATIIYPVAILRHGKIVLQEPESLTGQFATAAAVEIAERGEAPGYWHQPGRYLLTTDRLYRQASLIGIPRLRARARTENAKRWMADRMANCSEWEDYFRKVLIGHNSDKLDALERAKSRLQCEFNATSTIPQCDLNVSSESAMHDAVLRTCASGGMRS
ncbi:MAG: hypothetical protein JY451_01690 [Erythrobacter sp.]|nr:MAG: hypothetical protein JY451_01690 [Erythrobacter sp.]